MLLKCQSRFEINALERPRLVCRLVESRQIVSTSCSCGEAPAASISSGRSPAPSKSEIVRAKASSQPGAERNKLIGKWPSGRSERKSAESLVVRRVSSPDSNSTSVFRSTAAAATWGDRKRVPGSLSRWPVRIRSRRRTWATPSFGTSTVRHGKGPSADKSATACAQSREVQMIFTVIRLQLLVENLEDGDCSKNLG